MKKLLVIGTIVLAAASLVPKSALAEQPNLQYVGSSEGGDEYLLDYNSLRRNGEMIQYSYGVRFRSTHYDDRDRPSVGLYNLVKANCLTGQFQYVGAAAFGPGWVVTQSTDTPSSVESVHRNSTGAMVLAAACQATN